VFVKGYIQSHQVFGAGLRKVLLCCFQTLTTISNYGTNPSPLKFYLSMHLQTIQKLQQNI